MLPAASRYLPKKKSATDDDHSETFRRMRRNAIGDLDTPDLINAVWLHQLGHDDLAAEALEKAAELVSNQENPNRAKSNPRDREKQLVDSVKSELAQATYLAMIHAYMVRADDEALTHGKRLLKLYPDQARKLGQSGEVVADLERRQKKGTFGKTPDSSPKGFDSWDTPKKLTWLIDSLDEVDARQWGQPGGVPLEMDPRVIALVQLGDAAVPTLIDTIEKDERLTRSVHFWRDFSPNRTVLGVREAALAATMSILKVQFFEPNSTGDNFTARGTSGTKAVVAQVRAYWKKYGSMPLDEWMMKVLTDPHSSSAAAQEAAGQLAALGTDSNAMLNTTIGVMHRVNPEKKTNPAIKKFANPTVAEAMLTAMDRDLAAQSRRPDRYGSLDYELARIEDVYLDSISALGDTRIAAELTRRSQAAEKESLRRKYAWAAHVCGDSTAFKAFIADFREGKLKILTRPPNSQVSGDPFAIELNAIIGCLVDSRLPEADAVLYGFADPKNKYHASAAKASSLMWHPACIVVYRADLDDTKPNGTKYEISGGRYRVTGHGWSSNAEIPDYLTDPKVRQSSADGRVCDEAAVTLDELVLGARPADPLFNDNDNRLEAMRKMLDRFEKKMRRATSKETLFLRGYEYTVYVPDVKPLGRPATADDVANGLAIFDLNGQGKVAHVKLPSDASFAEKGSAKKINVLLLQAEVGADDKLIYGAVGTDILRYSRRRTDKHQTDPVTRENVFRKVLTGSSSRRR